MCIEDLIDNTPETKIIKSIRIAKNAIESLLLDNKALYEEILALISDLDDLRKLLGNEQHKGKYISKKTRTWVYRLQGRLKRMNLEYHAENINYVKLDYTSRLEEIWQQWIRLEGSYHDGLYYAFDSDKIEKTNNAKEQLIHKIKRHFRKWMGREDISSTFNTHGVQYAYLSELGLINEQIYEILWTDSVAVIEGYLTSLDNLYINPVRDWRIREHNTGNWDVLKKSLKGLKTKL